MHGWETEGPWLKPIHHWRCLDQCSPSLPKALTGWQPLAFQGTAACGAVQETDLALSPEQKRVLERKLKKELRKEARKRLREAGAAPTPRLPTQRSGAQLALDYLHG